MCRTAPSSPKQSVERDDDGEVWSPEAAWRPFGRAAFPRASAFLPRAHWTPRKRADQGWNRPAGCALSGSMSVGDYYEEMRARICFGDNGQWLRRL